MSRSRRKRPFHGISSSDSDKQDKRIANRRLRRKVRAVLPAEPDGVLPALREVSTAWGFNKDGRRRFDPGREPARMRK